MIYLEGCTVCAAGEVKSRAHAFKVYHTGTAFYFACDSREAMLAWIGLIHRATLLPSLLNEAMELSKQFSETDYSETESDVESSEKRNEKEKEREKEREKEKSKFGSLKKLTHRTSRSESQENVNQPTATSLDRKYLRFFSRARAKDDSKTTKKPSGVPVPTEHYRSYRRAEPASPRAAPPPAPANRLPKPINYIHASNPNLLDFEKSDFVTKPAIQVPKTKPHKPDSLTGFVTLEEFMLQKQAEERQQQYSGRVLLGVERGAAELQRRLARVVPDVIYGELPRDDKPASVTDKDGYETLVYPDERDARRDTVHSTSSHSQHPTSDSAVGSVGVSRLRLMFGGARRDLLRQESSRSEQYPHLQCPPTFQPETYSVARPPRARD